MIPAHDVARVRLDNAMLLFDEFVQATLQSPDDATLRGLERRFAERLQIQPSYWSQIKSRSRQIGERLARQFEQCCRKPIGWMDLPHDAIASRPGAAPRPGGAAFSPGTNPAAGSAVAAPAAVPPPSQPQDEDERFIVGLVLTYYRRHPQRARTRLLGLLGEVLTPTDTAVPAAALPVPAAPRPLAPGVVRRPPAPPAVPSPEDDLALWARTRQAVAPLQPKGKLGKPGKR